MYFWTELIFSFQLNYELFIARRIIASKERKNSVSSPIIKISILAIAIGIVVMLFSVATGVGLQKKLRKKYQDLTEIFRLVIMMQIIQR